MTAGTPRHLTREGLAAYLSAGVAAAVRIDGEPVVYLVIEPQRMRLSLRAPRARRAVPDLTAYRRLSAETVHWNDEVWSELRIEGEMVLDAYPVLCSMADRIQLQGADFGTAVGRSIAAFRELLASRGRLSEQQEVGLYGELMVLRHLMLRLGATAGSSAWRGPHGEEHDFDIGSEDVEVKTTTGEDRRHRIESFGQLEPTAGRPLWVVSVQLTDAASGGRTLGELIQEVRAVLGPDAAAARFDQELAMVGWRDDDAELYVRRLRPRSRPAVFKVDGDFPALTRTRLSRAGLETSRVPQISYTIDLTGLPTAEPAPRVLADFEGGGT